MNGGITGIIMSDLPGINETVSIISGGKTLIIAVFQKFDILKLFDCSHFKAHLRR
jgi:hypothetical protein